MNSKFFNRKTLDEAINLMVKKQLNKNPLKEAMTSDFTIYKYYDGKHEQLIAVYFDKGIADQISKILNQHSEEENFSEIVIYKVVAGTSASPARKK